MTTLPLGIGAYKRQFAGEVDIQLVNRFVEKSPSNLEEHVALLARPGNHFLSSFSGGRIRANITKRGLFSGDLFVVAGPNFYRYDGTTKTQITGEISGTDAPRATWMKGEGYELLFISDGTHLFYYKGAGNATGVLTYDGSGSFVTDKVVINGVNYSWGTDVTDPLADGSTLHPYIAVAHANPLADMANMLEFTGVPGVDFSDTLTTPDLSVEAVGDATTLTVTARVEGAPGNAITTTLGAGASGNLSWGAATLAGGGTHSLHQVPVPGAVNILALTSLAGFVLVAVGGTQKCFFIRPGEHTINALDFFEKEQNPDPVVDLATVGDVAVIAGEGSTEYWSATGDDTNPFAPIQGRANARGIVPGTLVVVDDTNYIAVGNDLKVYSFSPTPNVISDNGIDERIRVQLRREANLG